MTEAKLTAKLKTALENGLAYAVVIKHCDAITAGVPDMSVTWNGRTTWLEIKRVVNGTLHSKGIQFLMLSRLAVVGSAFYIVFDEKLNRTFMVPPYQLKNKTYEDLALSGHPLGLGLSGDGCPNNQIIVDCIRRRHSLDQDRT